MTTSTWISAIMARDLRALRRELEAYTDERDIWRVQPGIGNSAGNLTLHLAGNLQYFIGTVLGRTGYVRNREREFGQRSGPRENIYAELDAAMEVVRKVLPEIPDATLDADFPEAVMGTQFRTGAFLLHLCSHAGFHLGQAGYLRRILTGDTATSTGPIPLGPLAR